ncbi:hypothetical protein [Pontibacter sp. SGAir0037]|uniref:hypothetical protein n=1 Tax=Pontibacter sp. SGAir0037 TaxID=2571030 RepID=UPI0010CD1D63|nr:hypothetical protein [Pontibacter sp. SGAir0037]QCR22495.1 hypothetical protein C1N53_09205 [Pontibacter sp. SGAir0037]
MNARLTIAPGVVIEFEADKGLEVALQGALIANGTASQTITFTGKQKVKGFWRGILIQGYNEFDHVEVAYGGGGGDNGISGNVTLYGETWSSISLKASNTTFSNSGSYGVYLGVGSDSHNLSNVTFTSNTRSSMYAHATVLPGLASGISLVGGNGHNGVATGGHVPYYTHLPELVWPALEDGATYLVTDDIILEADVKIAPGATFEFKADKAFYIRNSQGAFAYGSLVAKGTADKPITFTGYSKQKGYWKGIMFSSSSQRNELDHVKVLYAGNSNFYNFPANVKTNIGLAGTIDQYSGYASPSLKISNTESSYSGGYGFYIEGEAPVLHHFSGNRFSNNTGAALYIRANLVHKLDNNSRFSNGNGFNGIETEGTVSHNEEITWPTAIGAMGVHVVGDLFFESGVKIISATNKPVSFQFDSNKALHVRNNGYLIAKGSAEGPVSFGGYPTPQFTSNWQGIFFDSNSSLNELHRVTVSNGGMSNNPVLNPMANITVRGAAKVVNSYISGSLGYGIFVSRAATVNTDAKTSNTFEYNTLANYIEE